MKTLTGSADCSMRRLKLTGCTSLFALTGIEGFRRRAALHSTLCAVLGWFALRRSATLPATGLRQNPGWKTHADDNKTDDTDAEHCVFHNHITTWKVISTLPISIVLFYRHAGISLSKTS